MPGSVASGTHCIKRLTKGSLLTRHPLNSTCNQSSVFWKTQSPRSL